MGVRRVAATAAVLAMIATGCGSDDPIQSGVMGVNGQVGPIELLSVYLEAPPRPRYLPDEDALVWLTLINSGPRTDTLVEVTSPVAEDVDIHWDQDCDGRFEPVPALPLPPKAEALGDQTRGAPPFDAYHLRLVDFTQEVLAGTNVAMTFRFERAGTVTLHPHVQPPDVPRLEPDRRCRP